MPYFPKAYETVIANLATIVTYTHTKKQDKNHKRVLSKRNLFTKEDKTVKKCASKKKKKTKKMCIKKKKKKKKKNEKMLKLKIKKALTASVMGRYLIAKACRANG